MKPGRSWQALPLQAHEPTLPGPMGVMICLDFLHREHEQHRQLVGQGLDTCRFVAVPSLTPHYTVDEFAATASREALRYKRPVLYCDIADGGGTTIYVDAIGRKQNLQPFPDVVGYFPRGDEGVIVADIDLGLQAPGRATAYEYDEIVRPVAAASLVYRCVPTMAEYAEWLGALELAMAGQAGALGAVVEQVERAEALLERVGQVPGGEVRTARLGRLRRELDRVTDIEDIRRFTREVVVPDAALPLLWLRAAMAGGAAEEVDRWFAEHRDAALLFEMRQRLEGGCKGQLGKLDELSEAGRAAVAEVRARVSGQVEEGLNSMTDDDTDEDNDADSDTDSDTDRAAAADAPTAAPLTLPKPLRVLVLATERDLGSGCGRVVDHLRLALGVEAEGGDAACQADPGEYDHVVLLQGWWWDGGRVAARWQRAPADRRTVMLVDEDADWPPRRLTERGADAEVEAFRAGLTEYVLFQRPEELPGLVGERISRVLDERAASSQDMGLRPWERRYLERRIPAWRAGRTVAGRSHLLDAQERTELYRPELYVPLNGRCGRWYLDEEDTLAIYPPEAIAADHVVGIQRQHGVPLARWLSEPLLPRLTIIGAPGGGKTVFLTRTASVLASLHLGRAEQLELHLDIEALRASTGRVPVPLLVDAPRIADFMHPDEPRPLVRAALRELGATDDGAVASQLREGIEHGRYILFIDALDEIADARKRVALIDHLKGMATYCPRLRMVMTTRSARYTGTLSFGPEFEVLELVPFDDGQTWQFCARWTATRDRDADYRETLQSAVRSLNDNIDNADGDRGIASNPLMLTAVCLVFERHRALPDDRAQLCSLLVDDLLRSRESRDPERNWLLSDNDKRDLLERMALGMQREGVQSWPFASAEEVALKEIPQQEVDRQARATKHVQWVAEHTGLLRFEQPADGPEQLRFWHRLFREYLAASRLARQDMTVADLVADLWQRGNLTDPFWEDVVRLLPGVFGEREKANALVGTLRALAEEHVPASGRLHGLATAAIIESRGLFPGVDVTAMACELADLYERDGEHWSQVDRRLLLIGLGRLDPVGGDPRLHAEQWIPIDGDGADVLPFAIGRFSVSVQEYRQFVDSDDVFDERWWYDVDSELRTTVAHSKPSRWRLLCRNLNFPAQQISFTEAQAYCRWLTARRNDDKVVRLPSLHELQIAGALVALEQDTGGPVRHLEHLEGTAVVQILWANSSELLASDEVSHELRLPPDIDKKELAYGSDRVVNTGLRCVLAAPARDTDQTSSALADPDSAQDK